MAWTYNPVTKGRRVNYAQGKEMAQAILERLNALTLWNTTLADFWANGNVGWMLKLGDTFRQAIETLIPYFYWFVSYTDKDTWEFYQWTTGADNDATFPKQRNIFKQALGPSYTDWRHSYVKGRRANAEGWNDFRLVLNKLSHMGLPNITTSKVCRDRATGDFYDDCAAVLTDLNGETWTDPASDPLSHYAWSEVWVSCGSILWPYWWNSHQYQQAHLTVQRVEPTKSGFESITNVGTKGDVYLPFTVEAWRYYVDYGVSSGYLNLARALTTYWREGSGSGPSTYAAARTFGSAMANAVFPSGDENHGAPYQWMLKGSAVVGAGTTVRSCLYNDCDDPTASGVCEGLEDYEDIGHEYINAIPPVTSYAPIIAEMDFAKVA